MFNLAAGKLALAGKAAVTYSGDSTDVPSLVEENGRFPAGHGAFMRRWALEARGYTLAHVVAAPDADAAFARLLTARPDLADDEIPALRAP